MILSPSQGLKLIVIGDSNETDELQIPNNYHHEAFGSLRNVMFDDGKIYLPVSHRLGAGGPIVCIGNSRGTLQFSNSES